MLALKRLAFLVFLPCALGQMFGGCSGGLKSFDEVNDPTDDTKLSECRAEARADKQIYGDADRAYGVYLRCTQDAGLR